MVEAARPPERHRTRLETAPGTSRHVPSDLSRLEHGTSHSPVLRPGRRPRPRARNARCLPSPFQARGHETPRLYRPLNAQSAPGRPGRPRPGPHPQLPLPTDERERRTAPEMDCLARASQKLADGGEHRGGQRLPGTADGGSMSHRARLTVVALALTLA